MARTIRPNYFGELQILPNGNVVASNWCCGHGIVDEGIQVLEFDPAGDLVWFWKQAPNIQEIEGVLVLDGLDPRYLHVQETSDDSTWQPVSPRP